MYVRTKIVSVCFILIITSLGLIRHNMLVGRKADVMETEWKSEKDNNESIIWLQNLHKSEDRTVYKIHRSTSEKYVTQSYSGMEGFFSKPSSTGKPSKPSGTTGRPILLSTAPSKSIPEVGPDIIMSNNRICKDLKEGGAILYIYTHPANVKARSIIRGTYASDKILKQLNMKRIFMLGKSVNGTSEYINKNLLVEQRLYGDIVVGNFHDSYRNLSMKGLTALKFIAKSCQKVRWIIKCDDDVIADTPTIMKILRGEFSQAKRTLFGSVYTNTGPIFCPTIPKWCINKTKYGYIKIYPDYLLGIGFALTADMVPLLLNQSQKLPYFPIDDAYMTGLLAQNVTKKIFVNWKYNILVGLDSVTPMEVGKHYFVQTGYEGIPGRWSQLQEDRINMYIKKLMSDYKPSTKYN